MARSMSLALDPDLRSRMPLPHILVLGGGPDSEREVSLRSSAGVARALSAQGHHVTYQVIDSLTGAQLGALPGDLIFPVLHGGWGEGGPLQELLAHDGRPYVGCTAHAARLAMDKVATKLLAAQLGIPTAPCAVLNPSDTGTLPPLPAPAVIKPIHEGSSVGLHVCNTAEKLTTAAAAARVDQRTNPHRIYMIEAMIVGARELTVPVLDGQALPVIEITPAEGVYDYQAKYTRKDTIYTVGPTLPGTTARTIQVQAQNLFNALGARHLARIDFMLGGDGVAYLLEANTMPGFTDTSLVPKSAASVGISYAALCEVLVGFALRDHA
jgi:D-alanine-D-alanine ligase